MTTHPIAEEELMAYLDGELPSARAATTAAHLEHCRECQALAADLQGISHQLMEWQIDQPDSALRDELVEMLQRTVPRRQEVSRNRFSFLRARPWLWSVSVAAVLVLVGVMVQLFAPPGRMALRGPGRYMALEESAGLQRDNVAPKQFMVRDGLNQEATTSLPARALRAEQLSEPNGPLIVRTAEMSVTTQQFDKMRGEITRLLSLHQGYVAQLSVSSPSDQGHSLTATLRVPAAQLDSLLSELRKIGRVQSESQSGQEVTQQYIDSAARLKNARNTEQRLTDLLRQRTGKLSDVLAVEEQIDRTRGEIETMDAELKNLSTRIAFATVQLQVAEEYKEPLRVDHSSTLGRLRNAAVEGYRSVLDGAIGFLVFLLAYGPGLLIVSAVLFFPGRVLWREIVRPRLRRNQNA